MAMMMMVVYDGHDLFRSLSLDLEEPAPFAELTRWKIVNLAVCIMVVKPAFAQLIHRTVKGLFLSVVRLLSPLGNALTAPWKHTSISSYRLVAK